jgi:hypothetical protein
MDRYLIRTVRIARQTNSKRVSTLAPTADQELLFIVNGELEFLKTISEGIHYFKKQSTKSTALLQ